MTSAEFQTTKETATGMFARRICGDTMDRIRPLRPLESDFSFDWVNDSDIPPEGSRSDQRQHDAAWDLFFRDLRREWKKYINNYHED